MLSAIDPVAFSIGPFMVHWYGIAMACAAALGISYLVKKGKTLGFNEDDMLSLGLWVIVAGVVGARLMFVAVNFPHWFWTDPVQVIKVNEGGLAWHGGLLGGLVAGWLFLRKRPHLDFSTLADLAVPGVAVGYILIRFANIINHEVLGRTAELGFIWPAQLVGAGIGLVLLVRHFYLAKRSLPAGHLFWSFVLYHQLLRGAVEETVREMPVLVNLYVNEAWGIGFLTAAQLATLPIMLFAWWMLRRAADSAREAESKAVDGGRARTV